MRKIKFAAGLVAASFLCAACDAKKSAGSGSASSAESSAPAADPKKRFESDLNALADEMNAIQASSTGNKLEDVKKAMGVAEKLETVDTTGLPADLVSAFDAVKANTRKSVDLMKELPADMPSDEAAMQEWAEKNPEAIQSLMELGQKMPEIQQEAEAAEANLKEVATTHGIDLTKFIESGKNIGQ